MFRHKGKRRSYGHNLRLASILSFVAGIVNIVGLLSVNVLTTNVTGHFAFFSSTFVSEEFSNAVIYLWFLVSFLAGAFCSNLISETIVRIRENLSYVVPILLEIILLVLVATLHFNKPDVLACILLFAMGLQNALVTRVSQSVVRTTHLTGIFTDLGIELSQLLFYKTANENFTLKRSIYLKLAIILCFFAGGIAGGFAYYYLKLKVLLIASLALLLALLYDYILLKFYVIKRKVLHRY
ncbi:YoaK family protein [Flavobacterium beibuense]|uniref:Putative membrane protein n=1 Tax=Flavobacterium beibuense TaxID=657326 RepID=A0A444W685_9FLAO|nr:YoaK family protein [Flavobacterium beibuense]RYJ41374.1 putative membrane protein [Flavobacterium beibuense]